MSLKPTLKNNLQRSYSAHLWEDVDIHSQKNSHLHLVESTWLGDKPIVSSFMSDRFQLYEDPEYLKQYAIQWDNSDITGKAMIAEHDAYLSSMNKIHLRKVFIHSFIYLFQEHNQHMKQYTRF